MFSGEFVGRFPAVLGDGGAEVASVGSAEVFSGGLVVEEEIKKKLGGVWVMASMTTIIYCIKNSNG